MTQLMYDAASVDIVKHVIPNNAKAVAGYVGPAGPTNRYVTFPAVVGRFYGHAHCLSIAAQSFLIAACLDVETGDAKPSDAPGWFHMVKAHGQWRPCFYADANTMPAVVAALDHAGIPRGQYRLWVAAYPGTGANVPKGFDAHQYADHGPHGENYDMTVINDDFFPRPKKRPTPPPKPHPKVTAAGIAGALTTALLAFLNTKGVHLAHLSPAETGAITTAAAVLAGYFKRAQTNAAVHP